MKSRFITIGTVVGSIALGQALALAEDATKPGTTRLQSPASGQQVSSLEGKIMPLHAYLAGTSWSGNNAGSAATSSSTSTSTSQTQRDRTSTTDTSRTPATDTSRTPATDPSRADRDRDRDRTNPNPTDTTRTSPAGTTRTDASNPSWQGWAGTGAGSSGDQTMVFVAMRGATLAPTATSTSTERNPNSPVTTTPPPASFATSAYGEAYVLLCNHNDSTSRDAFSKVQSLSSPSDRVQVSAKEESDATRRSDDPARQPATDRSVSKDSTSKDYKPYAPKYGQGVLEGKMVKVSGKILSRGGIQAIEVTSIEDASATSPTATSTEGSTIK